MVIGRDMTAKLLEYPHITADSISLIPNWATLPVDYREFDADNPFRVRCGGRFIAAMSGNAGFTHDPESVFEAARILKDNREIHFLLSGEGVGWAKIKEMQTVTPLPNVTLLERGDPFLSQCPHGAAGPIFRGARVDLCRVCDNGDEGKESELQGDESNARLFQNQRNI